MLIWVNINIFIYAGNCKKLFSLSSIDVAHNVIQYSLYYYLLRINVHSVRTIL